MTSNINTNYFLSNIGKNANNSNQSKTEVKQSLNNNQNYSLVQTPQRQSNILNKSTNKDPVRNSQRPGSVYSKAETSITNQSKNNYFLNINESCAKFGSTPFNKRTGPKQLVNEDVIQTENKNNKKISSNVTINNNKPSLNYMESRNNLISYSKSKNYDEDRFRFNRDVEVEVESAKNNITNNNLNKNESKNIPNGSSNKIPQNKNKHEDLKEEEYEDENSFNNNLDMSNGIDDIDSKTRRLIKIQNELPVPISKKDDEGFKLLKMRGMKRTSFGPNKSVQKSELRETPSHQRNFQDELVYSTLRKKTLTHSVKKLYASFIPLTEYDDPNTIWRFPVYRDAEIGINEYWQAPLIESFAEVDEDAPTDDEQLRLAHNYGLNELQEAMDIFLEEGVACLRNKEYITYPRV